MFSNVDGLGLGLQRAGVETVGFCEIDPRARSVLAHNWPGVPCHDDVTTLDGTEWRGRVELVVGGSPCTDLSVAARRAGLGGEESRLFWDQCRIAAQCAARWLLWENVLGALTTNAGADFAAVLWGFTGGWFAVPEDGWRSFGVCVGPDGAVVWRVFDARYFGVAQRRRRVFAIRCAAADVERAIEVLAEPEIGSRGARPSEPAWPDSAVGTLVSPGPGGGSRVGADEAAAGQLIPVNIGPLLARGLGAEKGPDDNSALAGHLIPTFVPTLTARYGKGPDSDATDPMLVVDLAQITSAHNRSNPQPGDPAPSLAATGQPIAFHITQTPVSEDDFTPTLGTGGGAGQATLGVLQPNVAVRRLLPIECERLMGWPDDWTRWGRKPDGTVVELSDAARYRFCGLGVVSPNTEWIGRRLLEVAA